MFNLNLFEMKNLIIILAGAFMLIVTLFSCKNGNSQIFEKGENSVAVINVDSLKGKYLPIALDWNERILAVFIENDNTCELTIGYITAKFSALSTFAHRKIILVGENGHWDKKMYDTFEFADGLRMKLIPSYPANSTSPISPIPQPDKKLSPVEEVPLRN